MKINKSSMINIKLASSDAIAHFDEVKGLYEEATKYLLSHRWCKEIKEGWISKSWGFMMAIFLFEIRPESDVIDKHIWVVTGDLPPVYLDTESVKNNYEVIQTYIILMKEWIQHVNLGISISDCYPVEVEPTMEHAIMLASRVKIIEEDFLAELTRFEQ